MYYVSVGAVRNNDWNVLHDTELEQSIHGNLDLGLTRARDIFGPELTFVLLLLLLLLLLRLGYSGPVDTRPVIHWEFMGQKSVFS